MKKRKKHNLTCEQCGQIFEAYHSEKRRFCSRRCYSLWLSENRRGGDSPFWKGGKVKKTCEWCGKEFKVKSSRVDKARFCSRRCHGLWQSGNRVGDNGANWKGGKIKLVCEQCGNEFKVTPARIGRARFCSKECRSMWLSENFNGENSHLWKGGKTLLICEQCGQEFEEWLSNRVSETAFCSAECYGLWQSENHCGENNPSWKGGISFEPYSPEWTEELKEEIRKRDNYTCAISGEIWQPGQPTFHVHHIDADKKNCDRENLITLAPNYHAKTNSDRHYWQTILAPIAKEAERQINVSVESGSG